MTKNISIPALTRVEGEGALYIRSKDNKIEHIEPVSYTHLTLPTSDLV